MIENRQPSLGSPGTDRPSESQAGQGHRVVALWDGPGGWYLVRLRGVS